MPWNLLATADFLEVRVFNECYLEQVLVLKRNRLEGRNIITRFETFSGFWKFS